MNLANFDATRDRYQALVPGAKEIIREPLYDTNTYLAAGQTSMNFFSVPIGQGTSVQNPGGGGPKTVQDTNMDIAGSLPAGKNFLVECIELHFFPAGAITQEGLDPQAVTGSFADDVYTFLKNGSLRFFVSSKDYLNQAPLAKFPPAQRMYMDSAIADSTTAAATQLSLSQYASGAGAIYRLSPSPVFINQNTNFSITLSWGEVLALPSATAAVVVATLGGVLYRRVQ